MRVKTSFGLLAPRALVALAFALPACTAAARSAEEDAVADEPALTGSTCEVGKNCPASMTLLEAGNLTGNTPARYANILLNPPGEKPRVLKAATTGVMRLTRNDAKLLLRGPTPGAPIEVTDMLFFEVLSPTGGVINRGFAGRNSGKALRFFDAVVPRLGGADSRTLPAGAVDLSPILPKDNIPFKVRVSAIVASGPSSVTDVVADIVLPPPAPPLPPGPIDPWDTRSCTGTPLTSFDAARKIGSGALHVDLGRLEIQVRKRACSNVTDCAEWTPAAGLPYTWRWSDPKQGSLSAFNLLPLPGPKASSIASFDVRDRPPPIGVADPSAWTTRLHLSYLTGPDGFDADLTVNGPKPGEFDWDGAYNPSWVGPCSELRCQGIDRSRGGSVTFRTEESLVTKSCLRIVASTSGAWDSRTGRDEYRILFSARY